MRSIPVRYVILFVITLIADQVTKFAIDQYLNIYRSIPVVGNYVRLTYIRNQGVAFGFTFGTRWVMVGMTALVILLLIYLIVSGELRPAGILGKLASTLVLSGAVGNMADRIRFGEVIDFIDMGFGSVRWPVYNFADIYVTVGMFLFFFSFMKMNNMETVSDSSS